MQYRSNVGEDFFSGVYRKFKKPITRYVSGRIDDEAVAEEITQEIFLKVFRFRDTYQADRSISIWLWAIARNAIVDHLRGKKDVSLNREVSVEDAASGAESAETLILTKGSLKERRKKLFRLSKSLTPPQKKVLWLRAVHQLSFQEIARRLGVSLSAAKNLAYRARLGLLREAEA